MECMYFAYEKGTALGGMKGGRLLIELCTTLPPRPPPRAAPEVFVEALSLDVIIFWR